MCLRSNSNKSFSWKMFSNFDSDLLAASAQSQATGSLTPILKKELWLKIQTRRLLEGKEELILPSVTPTTYKITQAEKVKKARRREQNRRAAKRFRQKEKRRRQHLLTLIDDFESRNERLETERDRLQQERSLILSRIARHTKLYSSCPKQLTPSDAMLEEETSQRCIPGSKRMEAKGRRKGVAARANDTAAECVEVVSALAGCSRDVEKGQSTVAVSKNASAEDGNEKSRAEECEKRPCRLADDDIGRGGICLLIRNLVADSTQQTIVLNIPARVVTLSEKVDSPRDQHPSQQPKHTKHSAFVQPQTCISTTSQNLQGSSSGELQEKTGENCSLVNMPDQPNSGQADPRVPLHDSNIRGFPLGKVSCQIVDGKLFLPYPVALPQSNLCDVRGGSDPSCGARVMVLDPPISPGVHEPPLATAAHDLCWQACNAASSHTVTSDKNMGSVLTTEPDALGGQVPLVSYIGPARCQEQPASYKGKEENSAGGKYHGGVSATSAPGSCKRTRMSRDAEQTEVARVRKRPSADSEVRRQPLRCGVTGDAEQRVRGRVALKERNESQHREKLATNVLHAQKTEVGHVPLQEHKMRSESLTPSPLERLATERYKSKMAGAEAASPTVPSHHQPGKESRTDGSQVQIENERRMQNIKHDRRFQQFLGSIFKTLGSSSDGTNSNLDMTPSTQIRPEVTGFRSTELRFAAATNGGVEKNDDAGGVISGLEQRLESLLLLHVQAADETDGARIDNLSTLTPSAQPSNLFSGFQDLLLESQDLLGLGLPSKDAGTRIPSQDFILSPALSLWKGSSPATAQGSLSGISGELQVCPSDWNQHICMTNPQPDTRPCSSDVTKDNLSPSLDSNSLVSQLLQCLPSRDLNDFPS